MVKVVSSGLFFSFLIPMHQGFCMEPERNGSLDPYQYPLVNNKLNNSEKSMVGFLSFVPIFGFSQSKPNDNDNNDNDNTDSTSDQKDPNSWATWARDIKYIPFFGRGTTGNVLRELEKGTFAPLVPENIARVNYAIEDLIDKKDSDNLLKLVKRLYEINFELNEIPKKMIAKFLEEENLKLKDRYKTDVTIKWCLVQKETEDKITNINKKFEPLLEDLIMYDKETSKYLNDKAQKIALRLTENQWLLANLNHRKYVAFEYTEDNVNAELGIDDKLSKEEELRKNRKEMIQMIINGIKELK